MATTKKGNVVFHEIVSEHEANKQEGKKLFEQLEKLFIANNVETHYLDNAKKAFIYG